ncbi:calcium/sodium antiporter [[Hallella] seregens]|uniref:Calcium/sodium antiporter n=1 Tax=Hallella seregens ATCC 51272 TaxID=1336250 RepID=A0ABV5ZIG5_9BACT|nr:calcium/sodium antiporter [Hallella seregens]
MYTLVLFSMVPQQMWLQVLILVAGIAVVLEGADLLTKGAVGLAERMGIPQIVIGLTIVAMGTSMPEFFVSLMSAINGTPDLAVGNVVGSNIFNALLIVGCAAVVAPITILRTTVRKDIPFALVASVVLLMMCLDGNVNRLDALLLLALFLIFMTITLRGARQDGVEQGENKETGPANPPMHPLKVVTLLTVGLAALILGSDVFVDNASAVARTLGVSDAIIGLTIVACGTSMPELATSVVAASRGNSGIAIGNVLGSNVFNILLILGITGMVSPMVMQGITQTDLSVMVVSMILLWLFSFTKLRIERWEGAVLTLAFVGYMTYLIGYTV